MKTKSSYPTAKVGDLITIGNDSSKTAIVKEVVKSANNHYYQCLIHDEDDDDFHGTVFRSDILYNMSDVLDEIAEL